MTSVLEQCSHCGFRRQRAPSAYPYCCGKRMVVVETRPDGYVQRDDNAYHVAAMAALRRKLSAAA